MCPLKEATWEVKRMTASDGKLFFFFFNRRWPWGFMAHTELNQHFQNPSVDEELKWVLCVLSLLDYEAHGFQFSGKIRFSSIFSFFCFVSLEHINHGYFKALGLVQYFGHLHSLFLLPVFLFVFKDLVLSLGRPCNFCWMPYNICVWKNTYEVSGWYLTLGSPFLCKQVAWGLSVLIQSGAELGGGWVAVLIRDHLTLAPTSKALPFRDCRWELEVFRGPVL